MNKSLILWTVLASTAIAMAADKPLRIYVPRSIQVQSTTLRLGDICIIRCDNEDLKSQAAAVAMGRAPFSQEKLAMDRRTILSRLACSGIDTADVEFSGADTVLVERKEQAILSDKLLSAAQEFLEKNRPGPTGCAWRLVGSAPDLHVENREDLQFQAHLAKNSSNERVRLVVYVTSGKEELANAELAFDVVYPARQAVAIKEIPAGEVIMPEHFKVQGVMLDRKPAKEFSDPTGMETTQKISAGAVIQPGMVKEPKPQLVVKRDQTVTMRIEGDGFRLSAMGTALSDGYVGQYIKVKNNDTQRIVTCKVAADASVSPVYEEVQR